MAYYSTYLNRIIKFFSRDFNSNLSRHRDHPLTENFFNTMSSYKFIHTILRPTRITESAASLIENIFTNCFNLNQDSCILTNDISDHLPTLHSSILILSYHHYHRYQLNATLVQWQKCTFINSLLETNLTFIDNLCCNDGPEKACSAFMNAYKQLYDSASPLTSVINRGRNKMKHPWMTKALLISCKENPAYTKNTYGILQNIINVSLHIPKQI